MRDYTQQRNQDFFRECLRQRKILFHEKPGEVTVDEIIARAAEAEAPSYYICYNHALRQIGKYMRGTSDRITRRSKRREMIVELAEKCKNMVRSQPELTIGQALARILTDAKASSYFLTFKSARRIYFEVQRCNHRRRNRKLL